MSLLHIDSSIQGDTSISRLLSAEIVKAERARNPGLKVVRRDLAEEPLPHISNEHVETRLGASPLDGSSSAAKATLDEFMAARIVVVGAPMYNLTIPSSLKAWLDRLAVAGTTFRYTESGVQGLAGGRKLYIASARGGMYGPETGRSTMDHQESYLLHFFGFMGLTDITVIRAEGTAMGPAIRESALAAAMTDIAALS